MTKTYTHALEADSEPEEEEEEVVVVVILATPRELSRKWQNS
jgi:hypothetical protein